MNARVENRKFIPHAIVVFMEGKDLLATIRLLKAAGYKSTRNDTQKGRSYEVFNPLQDNELVMTAIRQNKRYLVKYNPKLYS